MGGTRQWKLGPFVCGKKVDLWPGGHTGIEPGWHALWGGTFTGAVVRINVDPRTHVAEQTAKLPTFITRSLSDDAGHIFFTTDEGVYERDAADARAAPRKVTAADPLLGESHEVDSGCKAPDGTLWFMTNKHLLRLKGGQRGRNRPSTIWGKRLERCSTSPARSMGQSG